MRSDMRDAATVRAAITTAIEAGHDPETIAREAGSCGITVDRILAGQTHIRRDAEARLLAAVDVLLDGRGWVDPEPEPEPAPSGCTGWHVRVVRTPRGWGVACRDCHRSRWLVAGTREAAQRAALHHRIQSGRAAA